jgi:hypothetical protein
MGMRQRISSMYLAIGLQEVANLFVVFRVAMLQLRLAEVKLAYLAVFAGDAFDILQSGFDLQLPISLNLSQTI